MTRIRCIDHLVNGVWVCTYNGVRAGCFAVRILGPDGFAQRIWYTRT